MKNARASFCSLGFHDDEKCESPQCTDGVELLLLRIYIHDKNKKRKSYENIDERMAVRCEKESMCWLCIIGLVESNE